MIPTREQIASWSNMAVAWSYENGVVERSDSSRVGLVNERLVLYRGEVDNAANWISAMRDDIDRLKADLCEEQIAGTNRIRDLFTEIDKLRAELAALKPSEDREAAIRAWEAGAMAVEDDGDYHPIDVYRVTLGEIRDAVALMRSAGDGKALLRELRAKMVGHGYLDLDLPMRTIDEMLAQSAPVEQPAAAVPETFHNEFHAAFAKASEPLIKFLNDHPERLHPHHTVIVTQTGAELLEGSMSHKTTKHVRD